MRIPAGAREVHPQLGDSPGPDEFGFVMCEHGHVGQTFIVDDDVNVVIPKGQWNPYCVGCIMLDVVKRSKMRPMKFYIAQKSAISQPASAELIVPESGLILPQSAVDALQRKGGHRHGTH